MTARNPVTCAEANFTCFLGPQKAYFELDKTIDASDRRVVYVAYAARADNPKALSDWLIDSVLNPLLEKGGRYLYWRLPEKIDFSHPSVDAPEYRIYTRIAVLDKDLQAVSLPDMVKPEGVAMRKLENVTSI